MDLSKMLAAAEQMRGTLEQKLSEVEMEASTGGGLVTARVNGRKQLLRLTIAPAALAASGDDISMLEDLITAAVNQANEKADRAAQTASMSALDSLNLPLPTELDS